MKNNSAKDLAGRFIVIDGPDGSGKTTQLGLLAEHIRSLGLTVVTVRDPGGTDIGEAIRQILLSPAHEQMTAHSELLLYTAARLQLWRERIVPALKAGSCVLSDRWIYSTCAYQGSAGQLGLQAVCQLTDAVDLPWAHRAVILDLDPQVGLSRLSGKPDRMESKPLAFHRGVRDGYLSLAKVRPEVTIVDATGSVQQVQAAINRALDM